MARSILNKKPLPSICPIYYRPFYFDNVFTDGRLKVVAAQIIFQGERGGMCWREGVTYTPYCPSAKEVL